MITAGFRFIGFTILLSNFVNTDAETPPWKEIYIPREVSMSITKPSIQRAEGWVPTKKAYEYGLADVNVMVGIPDWDCSSLHGENSKIIDDHQSTDFVLDRVPKTKKRWLACTYRGTDAELRLQLPERVKIIRITRDSYNRPDGFPNIIKVEYQ
jgi:hypothetical protein